MFGVNIHLTSVVQSIAGNRHLIPVVMEREDDVFPLTSMEELDRLEKQLSERVVMEKMVRITVVGLTIVKKFKVKQYILCCLF